MEMSTGIGIREADAAIRDGSFFALPAVDAARFVVATTSNPADGIDSEAAASFLLSEYGRVTSPARFVDAELFGEELEAERRAAVDAVVADAAGMTPEQYADARTRHAAGDGSALLEAYGRFIRRC